MQQAAVINLKNFQTEIALTWTLLSKDLNVWPETLGGGSFEDDTKHNTNVE